MPRPGNCRRNTAWSASRRPPCPGPWHNGYWSECSPRWRRACLGSVLRDAHKCDPFDALEHVLEAHEAPDEDDWPWLGAISAPSAEPGADPGGIGQRAGRMRVLLALGFAFEGLADALDQRLIGGREDIGDRAGGLAVAIMHHLLDLDRRDQGGAGAVLQG